MRSCIKVACDFLGTDGVAQSTIVTQEFRRESMPDVLQLQGMLWHAWVSLSLRPTEMTRELTRIQKKHKRRRETPRALEDAARRKKQKRDEGYSPPLASSEPSYLCPDPACSLALNSPLHTFSSTSSSVSI